MGPPAGADLPHLGTSASPTAGSAGALRRFSCISTIGEAGETAEPFGSMVEARSLRVAINAALHAHSGVRVFAPADATVQRESEGATVRIAGGPTVACRLVVAAEGRGSPLREQAGIPVTRFPYGQDGHRLGHCARAAAP